MVRNFVDALFQDRGLFGGGALLGGELGAGFVFDLDHEEDGLDRVWGWSLWSGTRGERRESGREHSQGQHTAISKSTIFSVKLLISLSKHTLYSPTSCAVKTKSPCRSFVAAMMILSLGPVTV